MRIDKVQSILARKDRRVNDNIAEFDSAAFEGVTVETRLKRADTPRVLIAGRESNDLVRFK